MTELNKKLAEWAGLKLWQEQGSLGRWFAYHPEGASMDLPRFTQSLDACFEWLVPMLYPLGKQVLLVNLSATRNHAKIVDAFAREEIIDGLAGTPALALCQAIEKLIDKGEVKDV